LYEFQFLKSSESTVDVCLDLGLVVTPRYIAEMPADPLNGSAERTLYAIRRIGSNIEVFACGAELGEEIRVTR
jgi:hypothetical protein